MLFAKLEKIFFYLTIFLLVSQLGRHFWPSFSFINGVRSDYLSPTLYVSDISIICLAFLYFARRKIFISSIVKKEYCGSISFVIFFLLIGIGVVLSKNPYAGLYGMIKIIEFIFFGFYIAAFQFSKKTFALSLWVGILFSGFLAMAQFIHHGSLGGLFYFFGERAFNGETPGIANASIGGSLILRPYATFPHPNVLAGYLLFTTLLFLHFFESNKHRVLFISFTVLVAGIGILLSLSRAVWIMGIVLGSYLFIKHRLDRYSIFIFSILVFALVIFSQTLFASRLYETSFQNESVAQRIVLARASIDMFKDHMFFGVGLNNYLGELSSYITRLSPVMYQPVHSIFLLLFSEGGIFSFGMVVYFLYLTTKNVFSLSKKDKEFCLMLLCSFLFIGLFDHYFFTLQQGQLLMTLVLGVIWNKILTTSGTIT